MLRKYKTKPVITKAVLSVRSIGRNQPMPLVPQYKSLERAAALETLAKPKNTRTMLGKQHSTSLIPCKPLKQNDKLSKILLYLGKKVG